MTGIAEAGFRGAGPVEKVLFVDDERAVRLAAEQTLDLAGFAVVGCSAAEPALALLDPDFPGILVSDVRMPGLDGLGLLRRVRAIDPDLPVILVTGHGDVAMAVQAMRDGAYDFIEKPWPADRLIESVRRALEKRRLVLENRALKAAMAAGSAAGSESPLIGRTPPMERLRKIVATVADTAADVLLIGETGAGKELVARALHEHGPRRDAPFVAINCGALPEPLLESELFGHVRGAFTGADRERKGLFEIAHGGTLFLDEIAEDRKSVV